MEWNQPDADITVNTIQIYQRVVIHLMHMIVLVMDKLVILALVLEDGSIFVTDGNG